MNKRAKVLLLFMFAFSTNIDAGLYPAVPPFPLFGPCPNMSIEWGKFQFDNPKDYLAHTFAFDVLTENVVDAFGQEGENSTMILGYELNTRKNFAKYIAVGLRGVMAYEDYKDDAGITINSGIGFTMEPLIGAHLSLKWVRNITGAPATTGLSTECNLNLEQEMYVVNGIGFQPYYHFGVQDLRGWHVYYEIKISTQRRKGQVGSGGDTVGKSEPRMIGLSFKTGHLDNYGDGGGLGFIFDIERLFVEIGLYKYEKGRRLTLAIGGQF